MANRIDVIAEKIAALEVQRSAIEVEIQNARMRHQELRRREALGERIQPKGIREVRLRISDLEDRIAGIEDALDMLHQEIHQAAEAELEEVEAKIRELNEQRVAVRQNALPEIVQTVLRLVSITGATVESSPGGPIIQLPIWIDPRDLHVELGQNRVEPRNGSPAAHERRLDALHRERQALQDGHRIKQALREARARAAAGASSEAGAN